MSCRVVSAALVAVVVVVVVVVVGVVVSERVGLDGQEVGLVRVVIGGPCRSGH